MSQELARYLEEQMNARGWSQRELARRSDVSLSTLQRALKDDKEKPIGWDGLANIAQKGLRLNPITLFVKAHLLPREPQQTTDEKHLLHVFRQLPPEQQQALIQFTDFLFTNRNRQFWIADDEDM